MMLKTRVNSAELEFEETGFGEPVLLINSVISDGFLPLASQPALAHNFRLIRYHRRGFGGTAHDPAPTSIADHAADAAELLRSLGITRAHVAGHSISGPVALQMAVDYPELVHSLVLLEPTLYGVPSTPTLLGDAAPSFEAFAAGDHPDAVAKFLSAISGLDWPTCKAVFDSSLPEGVQQMVEDADTVFGPDVAAGSAWQYGAEQAAAVTQPVLAVHGDQTHPFWREATAVLRTWFPELEEAPIKRVGHLLHIQEPEPVAVAVAGFLHRHPLPATTET